MRLRSLYAACVTALLWGMPAVVTTAWAEVPVVVDHEVGFTAAAGAQPDAGSGPAVAVAATDLGRSAPAAAPAFSMVSFALPDEDVAVRARVRGTDGVWQPWFDVEVAEEDEGPDHDSTEAARDTATVSEPWWVGAADAIQVQVEGAAVEHVRATVIDSAGLSGAGTRRVRIDGGSGGADAADRPVIRSRAQWGADESIVRDSPSYAKQVGAAIVHHTAGANDYGPDDVPAILRAIQRYHTVTRGWDDIGYNVLIDRFGRAWEGRAGGLDRSVIGAHASGFNTGSTGISVLGNFATGTRASEATLQTIAAVVAWKAGLHGFHPYGSFRFPNGVSTPSVIGHEDVGSTSCPGAIRDELSRVRGWAAAAMIPFGDVVYGGVHYQSIVTLWSDGIIQGCRDDAFCPQDALTRDQAASLLARTLGIPGIEGQRFSDVSPTSPHRSAINALAEQEIITGYDDGTFRPREPVSREQMSSILRRALRLEPGAGAHFSDVSPVSTHGPSVYRLAMEELVAGCTSSTFCPRDSISRAQVASLLHRTVGWIAARGGLEALQPEPEPVPVDAPESSDPDIPTGDGTDGDPAPPTNT